MAQRKNKKEHSCNYYRRVGKRLCNARIHKGISASKMAEALGISKEDLYKWERNNGDVPLGMIKQIEELLGIE